MDADAQSSVQHSQLAPESSGVKDFPYGDISRPTVYSKFVHKEDPGCVRNGSMQFHEMNSLCFVVC